ncbi:murein hydrolase activator EnvC family protein [Carboxylicivirga taeanensis]|uniref:murein hydrolase activator EnvC family protein n=1 Tax=Carboxylicivirga taeanensis TaxID=1416875 RepID=UPI003F6DDE3D
MMYVRASLLAILLVVSVGVSGQSLAELEKQKNALNERINNATSLLSQYSKERTLNSKNVSVLNRQISDRERLIQVYNEEIRLLESDIADLNHEITGNERKLSDLKAQYSKLITEAFKNKKRYNELSFFFGAESFNEAYRRYVMLKEYNKFRHHQGVLIQQKTEELNQANRLLQVKLQTQNNALNSLRAQHNRLVDDKQKISRNIQSLQQKESTLRKRLRQEKKALKKLEDTIVRLIAEMRNESTEPSDFHLSKGQLAWPVRNGVVISQFGEHQHPVLKYVKVKNNGVDIQSSSDREARVVFSGTVSRVVPIPGYNKAVLVRHGRFLTVYANIDNVSVKPGENVTKNSVIGTIYNGGGENSGVLHFEIWEESVKLNPELWLVK